eukprot:11167930-Lingulodinium_polyedra.AAC.1
MAIVHCEGNAANPVALGTTAALTLGDDLVHSCGQIGARDIRHCNIRTLRQIKLRGGVGRSGRLN